MPWEKERRKKREKKNEREKKKNMKERRKERRNGRKKERQEHRKKEFVMIAKVIPNQVALSIEALRYMVFRRNRRCQH